MSSESISWIFFIKLLISYMFLSLLIFPLISVFHILIHALSKSLLFLLAGSLIHIQLNFQSIYKIKINNSLIKNLFITGLIILYLIITLLFLILVQRLISWCNELPFGINVWIDRWFYLIYILFSTNHIFIGSVYICSGIIVGEIILLSLLVVCY